MFDRRRLLQAGVAGIGAGVALSGNAGLAHARPKQSQAQPGFYRLTIGDIEVTVISDGHLEFPAETLFGSHAEDAKTLLTSAFLPSDPVGLQLNTTLIKTGGTTVLVDAGSGTNDKFQPTAGRLFDNLAAAGVAPGDIDIVLLTHGHSDHLWGISDPTNTSLMFPKAEFVASEVEVKFWNSPELTAKVSPKLKPEVTRANLALARPRLRLIKAGAEVAPGVVTLDTPGHTPGHMSVLVQSGRAQLLLTADVVVNHPVDLVHPDWPFGFDQDMPLAAKSRLAFLDRAATDRTLVSGYHLPFPGVGHFVREGSGYRWIPADWQWAPV